MDSKQNHTYIKYISLGCNCAIAYQLQQMNLRDQAYPFDWILSPDIIPCLQDDFKDFLNPEYLRWKGTSSNFPILNEDWMDNTDSTNDHSIARVHHTKYKIIFLHDFVPTDDPINRIDQITKINSKYQRRINRFREIMKNSTVLKNCYRLTHSDDDDGSQLMKIDQVFQDLKYLNYQIIPIYTLHHPDWRLNHLDWRSIIR